MTQREEEIRARLDAIHAAKASGDYEGLSRALAVAQERALEDVAFLTGVLNVMRQSAAVAS
jgi:hypothetical protein